MTSARISALASSWAGRRMRWRGSNSRVEWLASCSGVRRREGAAGLRAAVRVRARGRAAAGAMPAHHRPAFRAISARRIAARGNRRCSRRAACSKRRASSNRPARACQFGQLAVIVSNGTGLHGTACSAELTVSVDRLLPVMLLLVNADERSQGGEPVLARLRQFQIQALRAIQQSGPQVVDRQLQQRLLTLPGSRCGRSRMPWCTRMARSTLRGDETDFRARSESRLFRCSRRPSG